MDIDTVREILAPVVDLIAYPALWISQAAAFVLEHPTAAILLSAALAAFIALRSIDQQRATTRLRETFASRQTSTWDKDVIEARQLFAELKERFKDRAQEIARFADPKPAEAGEFSEARAQEIGKTLRTILFDYENMALGILDEEYLYKLIRGSLITDWQALEPLVGAFRQRVENPALYIEFEALADAWRHEKSFRTGRRMRPTKKTSKYG